MRVAVVTSLVTAIAYGSLAGNPFAGAAGTAVPSAFVAIAPCRLFDTRPGIDNVGPRATPLGPGDIHTQQVTGTNGDCTVPATATAVALNVTTVNASADSFLTVFPGDLTTPPKASNLNWRRGDAANPNKVDVQLSPIGAIKLYNPVGTVDVLADVVGYYEPGATSPGPAGPRGLSAWDVIPSGVTVTGTEYWESSAVSAGQSIATMIDLPGVAPVDLTDAMIGFAPGTGTFVSSRTTDLDPTCTGTQSAPTAPPGKVCIYLYGVLNAQTFFASPPGALKKRGFSVEWHSETGGRYFVQLTWAYTAP